MTQEDIFKALIDGKIVRYEGIDYRFFEGYLERSSDEDVWKRAYTIFDRTINAHIFEGERRKEQDKYVVITSFNGDNGELIPRTGFRSKIYLSESEAYEVANRICEKWGKTAYVCKAIGEVRKQLQPVEIIKY